MLNISADNPSRVMVAQTIIALVEHGTTDPDQLVAAAVKEFQGPNR